MVLDQSVKELIEKIRGELLPVVSLKSVSPDDPIVVENIPEPWKLLGNGNFAAVFVHPDHPQKVVKLYAPGRPGIEEETEVYRRLGEHPAYSKCYYAGGDFLLLEKLEGMTLYECLRRAVRIPPQVIKDVDEALDYARERGLNPHDVHAKNVVVKDGHGMVVDVSDFLHKAPCHLWEDCKWAYYKLYQPFLRHLPFPIPNALLDFLRRAHRLWRRFTRPDWV